jgi:formylglycine-generating enzyme
MKIRTLTLTLAIVMLIAGIASATITIDMVPVGDINNAADTQVMNDSTTGYGSVGYAYGIGKYDVTAGQYAAFLNAVASTSDTYGLYNGAMAIGTLGSQITKNGSVFTAALPNQPIIYVSWGDAARFCNWLSNGQKTYAQDPLTTEYGSYTLNGYTDDAHLGAVTRNPGASYVIPTENEWYKAAYYDPNKGGTGKGGYWYFPTKSDAGNPPSNVLSATGTNNANFYSNGSTLGHSPYTTDVGYFANSPSAYGTFDQGGNVWQWNETAFPIFPPENFARGMRGGSTGSSSNFLASSSRFDSSPTYEANGLGFRMACVAVPEPGSHAMLLSIALCGLMYWKHKHA